MAGTEDDLMTFLDPKTDIAFKKLFSNQSKKEILISFLNSVLERKDGEKIVDTTVIDPINHQRNDFDKLSIVDARCIDQAGKTYIIEMQATDEKDYLERSQYYSAHTLTQQLKASDKYAQLTPVIFVGVLGFNLFKGSHYLNHHLIIDKETNEHALKHLEFHFIELEKFNKSLEALSSPADKWIYLFKHAEDLRTIPSQLKKPHELSDALEVLEEGTWSRSEVASYFRYVDMRRKEKSRTETALEKGLKKGLEKGLEKGLAKGGKQAAIKIAKRLLKTMSIKQVAQCTDLSITEIEKLKKNKDGR